MFKTITKRVIAIFFTVMLIVAVPTTALAADGFNQDVKKGTVLVLTELETTEGTLYSWGTGFFVGQSGENPEYLLTNYHVVEDFLTLGGGQGVATLSVVYEGKMLFKKIVGVEGSGADARMVVTSSDGVLTKTDYEEAYYVAGDGMKDIALLKIGKPTSKRTALLLLQPDESLIGNRVFAVGYPGSTEYTVNSTASFGIDDSTVTGGNISRLITETGTGRALIQTDVSISGGNSGGPLVDTNGAVLGLNTLASNLDSNLFYAVSINEAIPILRNNNINFGFHKEENPYIRYIYIGVAILAGLILVVLIILLVRKSKKQAAPVYVPSEMVTPPTPHVPSTTPAPQNTLQPILRSMSAQHGGMTVVLTRQPIYIGRDVASCRVVFKEGTPAVSSQHCQIYYDDINGVFVVTDLKSTYGTYLSNGQRLTPETPFMLRQRDSFYVGDQDNLFYVDLG